VLVGSASNNGNPANVKASYVSGGIDEVFAKQDGSGTGATTLTYLTDALGSTVRLVGAAGAKVVDYTYDPYGNTSADAAVDNPFQYTGRENDGTGLYYYRARYFSTRMARFISRDPIGLAGGINTYAYIDGNPLSYTDPLGLRPLRFPDYGSFGVPIFGPVGASIAIDRAGNLYGGLGIGAGGVRGGFGLSVGWTGDPCTPNSKQLRDFLGGWGANAGVGVGVSWSSPQDPETLVQIGWV
jgi:RHS repeat-associated protein